MLVQKSTDELSLEMIDEINNLTETTWPETALEDETLTQKRRSFLERNPNKTCHLFIQDELIGYAESFPMTIQTDEGEKLILALAAVCVSQNARGKGIGAQLVVDCFKRIDKGEFDVCLFQTGVPSFYEKLNCKLVYNPFVNSLNKGNENMNPFWDEHIMIYPSEHQWFTGKIDLLRTGY